jgi:hypothetical protein
MHDSGRTPVKRQSVRTQNSAQASADDTAYEAMHNHHGQRTCLEQSLHVWHSAQASVEHVGQFRGPWVGRARARRSQRESEEASEGGEASEGWEASEGGEASEGWEASERRRQGRAAGLT